jgi:DNA-binding MarR family transcriptional regulator
MAATIRGKDLSLPEFDILYQLWRAPECRCRVGVLASELLATPGGVSRLAARLADRGLVSRHRDRGRQAVEIKLTAQGETRLLAAMSVHFREIKELFVDRLDDQDIVRLVSIWHRSVA